MFGQNPVAKMRQASEGFLVKEMWYTIQGEGPWAGRPAVFLRLAGCNLRCVFCDTDFSGGAVYTLDALVHELCSILDENNCGHVVITGGEPMLQEIGLIINHTFMCDVKFQIETAGTVWPESMEDMGDFADNPIIVVSPKTPKLHPEVERHAHSYKYIITAEVGALTDGLPMLSTQAGAIPFLQMLARPTKGETVYVQPCDVDNPMLVVANMKEAVRVALEYGYILSLQIHKIVGLP